MKRTEAEQVKKIVTKTKGKQGKLKLPFGKYYIALKWDDITSDPEINLRISVHSGAFAFTARMPLYDLRMAVKNLEEELDKISDALGD